MKEILIDVTTRMKSNTKAHVVYGCYRLRGDGNRQKLLGFYFEVIETFWN